VALGNVHDGLALLKPNKAMSEEQPQEPLAWTPEPTQARTKPPAPSILRRLLPPVLGGLTSIPIAIGILWYGFGKDIGNAGPTIARYIPWLVPEHLRGSARWRYNPKTDSKQKQFDAPANLDAGEFGRIGGNK
jgi:hypothetical protein